jgi:hypothetical protein
MGEKTIGFVEKAYAFARQNPIWSRRISELITRNTEFWIPKPELERRTAEL